VVAQNSLKKEAELKEEHSFLASQTFFIPREEQ
jgi:hypothetical protein